MKTEKISWWHIYVTRNRHPEFRFVRILGPVDKQLNDLQEIEEAVQHYIATRDSGTQRRILSRWVVISIDPAIDHRKRRRSNEPEVEERPDQGLEKILNEIRDQEPNGALDQTPDQAPNQAPNQARNQDLNQNPNLDPEQDPDEASDEALFEILDEEFGKFRQDAVAFFAQRQKKRNQEDGSSKATLTWKVARDVFTSLRNGHQWNTTNDISKLWISKDPVNADGLPGDISQLQRLARLHEGVLSTEHSNEVKRRLTALLIHHECKENGIPIKKLKTKGKRKEVKERKSWDSDLAKPTGLSFATATDALNTSYAWIKFTKAWGLGGLVIPPPDDRYLSACPPADKEHRS
jgi:hypothetical protein